MGTVWTRANPNLHTGNLLQKCQNIDWQGCYLECATRHETILTVWIVEGYWDDRQGYLLTCRTFCLDTKERERERTIEWWTHFKVTVISFFNSSAEFTRIDAQLLLGVHLVDDGLTLGRAWKETQCWFCRLNQATADKFWCSFEQIEAKLVIV